MKAMYLEGSYLRESEAAVESASGDEVVLERAALYPRSAGQPCDIGSLVRRCKAFQVLGVEAGESRIVHRLDRPGLEAGDVVRGAMDWERRYRFMRSHTACHILSAVIFHEAGTKITGNQIESDRSRVDLGFERFDEESMRDFVERTSQIIKEDPKRPGPNPAEV
jgi:misacylated tRNA(Ala) deacylase